MAGEKDILIVDDTEETVVFMAQILEDHGFQFRIAKNGNEAMAAMGEKRPDLVLLDVMMPRKSGINVFNDMKRDPQLADIPIIIITGAATVTGVSIRNGTQEPKESYGDDFVRSLGSVLYEKLKDLEVDELLEKPIDPQLLIEKINRLLA
jgi:twitching motility two-component system response regulator PilH